MTPDTLTVRDVAERWRISEKTVRAMIGRGELIAFRIGRQIRVRADELVRIETEPRGREIARIEARDGHHGEAAR